MDEAQAAAWVGAATRAGRLAGRLPLGFGALRLQFRPDALLKVPTRDGAAVALARYYPRVRRRFAEPVILCHGLGANRFTFDFDARHSLARRLAERGFEAWILELRGRGESGRAPRSTFDLQAEHDVAAALQTVREAGARQVLWVGHSKGGLLAFAHLGRNPGAPIRAIAALGSPTSFKVQRGLRPFARVVRPLLAAPTVPLEALSRFAALVPPPEWFMRYLVHPENLDPGVRRRALVNVGADIAGGVARQFLRWITTGRWLSEDGRFDYERGLGAVRAPTLLVAGTKDLLAPPDAVAHTAAHLGGPHTLVVAGPEHGFREHYGHGDLMLGRHAPDELYARIADFLEAHATPHAG